MGVIPSNHIYVSEVHLLVWLDGVALTVLEWLKNILGKGILVKQDLCCNCRFFFAAFACKTKCPRALFLFATHATLSFLVNPTSQTLFCQQTSIDMMEKATQRLHTGFGMRMKLTTIMKAEVTNTD